MKQVEKLARDAAFEFGAEIASRLGDVPPGTPVIFRNGFERGFRAAREMAAELCERDILGGYGYNAARDIRQLGEEEA